MQENSLRKKILTVTMILIGLVLSAQTKDQITVALDLDAGTMGQVPFDQRFKLGKFKTAYDNIKLTYTIKDSSKKPNYFKGGSAEFIVDKTTSIATCLDIIEPLHPNVVYKFKFTVTKAILLTPDEEAAYRNEIFKLIEEEYEGIQSSETITDAFKGKLDAILKKYAKADKIISADGKIINVKSNPLFESSIYPVLDNIIKSYEDLKGNPAKPDSPTILKIIENRKEKAVKHFTDSDNNKFFKKLSGALNDDRLISDSFRKMLDSPINPSMQGNATLTLRQYLNYLVEAPVVRLTDIIEGKRKIVGNNHETAIEVDKNSLLLLEQIFEMLNHSTVTKPDNKTKYFSESEIAFIKKSIRVLNEYVEKITAKETELDLIAKSKNRIPNILKDAFISRDIRIEAGAEIDVLAEKNPYIGLDAGVGYAFGSANGMFIYEGANFYLRPINRNTDLSLLQGWDKFFKKVSFYIGIAQIVTEKQDSFESLLGSSNVLVGTGYRLNRAFRLNVGGLLHYKKDPNPIIDDKKITLSPTVSLSIDIDLVKALGAVGKALNIE